MTAPRLAELIATLALSAETAAGVPPETSSRAAIAAVRVAKAAGLAPPVRVAVYYAALLRYIGCTAFAYETAYLGAGDDIGLLRAMTPVDGANRADTFRRIVREAGRGAGAVGRARSIARMLSDPTVPRRLAEAHCAQAVALTETLRLPDGVLQGLAHLYERWDGKGGPAGLAREQISIEARVLRLAYLFTLHAAIEGAAGAAAVVRSRRGGEVDPALVDTVMPHAAELLETLLAPTAWDSALAHEPEPHLDAPHDRIADVAAAFATCADLKSPYLLGHSRRVADLCEAVAARAGGDVDARRKARVAGLLHDLGRTCVPNGIWDKPGKLTPMERERVEAHAVESERIVARSPMLAPWARIVGAHHERLDGSGYPRRTRSPELDREARVLAAADVFAALGEERPHRPARSPDECAKTLLEEARAGRLDRDAAQDVLAAAGMRVKKREAYPCDLSQREVEVLLWLARGLKSAEIGKKLFISPRTVEHHVAHVYDKTGMRTRAAIALFAARHGLVGDPYAK